MASIADTDGPVTEAVAPSSADAEEPAETERVPTELREGTSSQSDERVRRLSPIPRITRAVRRIRRIRRGNLAWVAATAVPLALAGVVGWQWSDLSDLHHADSERAAFLTTARQGAVNLTTIRWDNADSDVQRILDGSAGKFHDDFAGRAASFVAVVKQAKSTSQGEITAAGIESVEKDTAQVIVAANVKTTHVDSGTDGQQNPQSWRLRMTVHRDADRMSVTDVEFVP